jgi:hypothetical protein
LLRRISDIQGMEYILENEGLNQWFNTKRIYYIAWKYPWNSSFGCLIYGEGSGSYILFSNKSFAKLATFSFLLLIT